MSGGLLARIAATAGRNPDAPALDCGGTTLSRRQLLASVERAAAALHAQGLGRGAIIGWLGVNSTPMLTTLLGCAALGAVFVPLNWRLAAAELADIARHAGLHALLGTPELAPLADEVRSRVGAWAPPPDATGAPGGVDDDLLLAYTSGTTGRPKGALHTQGAMLANIDAAIDTLGLTEADRVLSVLPLFHVGGLCIQTLPALAVGAAVRLQPRFDPGAWLDDVASWRPTTSLLVPAAMRALLDHPRWHANDLGSLRFVGAGSSIVPLPLIEGFHARGVPVAQVYGSTESGPVSIVLRPGEALAHPGCVGRPAPGVRVRLVAADGADAAPGEVGEIWLAAPNLLRAYHRESDHPSLAGGWLRTGDLAQCDRRGLYTVVGRSREMIISGGENIYPAEIENVVEGWPGIAEAALVGVPDARWGEVPVLVIVPVAGADPDLDALRAALAARLARFKQPRRIVLATSLPRTALGKLQRAQLAAQVAQAG